MLRIGPQFLVALSIAAGLSAASCSREPTPATSATTPAADRVADTVAAASYDVDGELAKAAALVEEGRAEEGATRARTAFISGRAAGVVPQDIETLKRLQAALMPLAPEDADPRALVGTTIALAGAADLVTARTPLATWVQQRPASYSALLALGHLAHSHGHVEPARMWFGRATAVAPRRAEAIVALAILDAAAGDFEQAITRLDGVIRRDPSHPQAHLHRGTARAERGDEEGAIADWQRAVELGDSETAAAAENLRGSLLLKRGDLEGAVRAFQEAMRRDPRSAAYAYNAGQALHQAGRTDDAAVALRRTIELRPLDPRPHELLGRIADAMGDDAGAEHHYREALRLAPQDERARAGLQRLLERTGRAAEAAKLAVPKQP